MATYGFKRLLGLDPGDYTKPLPDITARLSRHTLLDHVQRIVFAGDLVLELELHVKFDRLHAGLSVLTGIL